jgi:hypothetical protein
MTGLSFNKHVACTNVEIQMINKTICKSSDCHSVNYCSFTPCVNHINDPCCTLTQQCINTTEYVINVTISDGRMGNFTYNEEAYRKINQPISCWIRENNVMINLKNNNGLVISGIIFLILTIAIPFITLIVFMAHQIVKNRNIINTITMNYNGLLYKCRRSFYLICKTINNYIFKAF